MNWYYLATPPHICTTQLMSNNYFPFVVAHQDEGIAYYLISTIKKVQKTYVGSVAETSSLGSA